jgi:DNA segregation ATPase FtsK/SpoIIIE, S-DNA-T family
MTARAALITTVREQLALARAAARTTLAGIEAEHWHARAALDAARHRLAAQEPHLATARANRLAAAHTRYAHRRAELARELAAMAGTAASGAAGEPWAAWTPSRTTLPGLYRIGTLAGYDVPALVPLLDHAHLSVCGGTRPATEGLVAGLLLRAIGAAPPGAVRVHVYDPERLGRGLAGFAALAGAGLLRNARALPELLDELVGNVHRITERVLAGEYPSLRALAEATGRRPEPWRIAVILAPPELDALEPVARAGIACGVHLVVADLAVPGATTVHLGQTVTTSLTGTLPVALDPVPPARLVTSVCRALAAGPPPANFADLLPEKLWTESSVAELRAPFGEGTDGRLVELVLGDDPPHALIAGPSGSGKTNLIYAWLAGLTSRYSPDELELYLLDFKEGVSFARFAPGRRDPSWLPQVRLVGVNVNTDREFGLALLRHLSALLRERAAAAREHEATKLAELRVEDPGGHWPRVVAVIDEVQALLSGRDAVTAEAVALLEDLARRGRSQGIHLVLASQDLSGIEALWGRSALVAQFTLRIALPKARRVLADTNLAAETLPRFHAIVNAESGIPSANRIVRLPDAGTRTAWEPVQTRLWHRRAPDLAPPRLFDGDAVPALPPTAFATPTAVVGAAIDVTERAAGMPLTAAPGRNLAVLGTRTDDACAVLASAARSLAHQQPSLRFTVVCRDGALRGEAEALNLGPVVPSVEPTDGPRIVVGYALDGADLRELLHTGPERGVHVLGWWRGVGRLRDSLGGLGARFDAIGAWVALDVQGADLAPLCPVPSTWYPRPRRGLFFDRTTHRVPEVVLPYGR